MGMMGTEKDNTAVMGYQDSECAFPFRVYDLLEDASKLGFEHIVSWVKGDAAFAIHNRDHFARQIMPRYFQQTQYKSFQRQLNFYQFERAPQGPYKGSYSHPYFVRENRKLCHLITRRTTKAAYKQDTGPTSSANSAVETTRLKKRKLEDEYYPEMVTSKGRVRSKSGPKVPGEDGSRFLDDDRRATSQQTFTSSLEINNHDRLTINHQLVAFGQNHLDFAAAPNESDMDTMVHGGDKLPTKNFHPVAGSQEYPQDQGHWLTRHHDQDHEPLPIDTSLRVAPVATADSFQRRPSDEGRGSPDGTDWTEDIISIFAKKRGPDQH